MKRFSYANTCNAYLSAVLFTFCYAAVLYPRNHSVHKPTNSYANQSESHSSIPTNCSELTSCLKPVFNQQTDKLIAACSFNTPCDERITFSSPTTITQSGSYCLLADLDVTDGPAIAIAAGVNDVVIDLNNHIVSGTSAAALIEVPDSASNRNLTILNGTIRPLGSDTIGIRIQNSSEVVLSGLSLRGNHDTSGAQRGVLLSGLTDFSIDNCSVTQVGFVPFELSSCVQGKITCCQIFNNDSSPSLSILRITNSNSIVLKQVACDNNNSDNNTDDLNSCFAVNDSSDINFLQCTANSNLNLIGRGFLFNNSSNCFCKSCESSNNIRLGDTAGQVVGFDATNSRAIVWDSCIARNNSTRGTKEFANAVGFFLSEETTQNCSILNCIAEGMVGGSASSSGGRGFEAASALGNYLYRNIAISNANEGFANFDNNDNVFFSNVALGNTPDYSSNIGVIVEYTPTIPVFPSEAGTFSNVDILYTT